MTEEFIEGMDLSGLVYYLLVKAGYDVDRQEAIETRCESGENQFCYLVGKNVFFAVHRRFTGETEEVGRVIAYTKDPVSEEDIMELQDAMDDVGAPIGWFITTRFVSDEASDLAREYDIEVTDGPGLATMIFEYLVLEPTAIDGRLVLKTPDDVEIDLYVNEDR